MVSCGKLVERETESKTSTWETWIGVWFREGIVNIIVPGKVLGGWPQASRWLLCDPRRE